MIRGLAWLAAAMRNHKHSEFRLDLLQPDWLPTATQRRLATLFTMVLGGLAVRYPSGWSPDWSPDWFTGGALDWPSACSLDCAPG
jgi:hypothetical protein